MSPPRPPRTGPDGAPDAREPSDAPDAREPSDAPDAREPSDAPDTLSTVEQGPPAGAPGAPTAPDAAPPRAPADAPERSPTEASAPAPRGDPAPGPTAGAGATDVATGTTSEGALAEGGARADAAAAEGGVEGGDARSGALAESGGDEGDAGALAEVSVEVDEGAGGRPDGPGGRAGVAAPATVILTPPPSPAVAFAARDDDDDEPPPSGLFTPRGDALGPPPDDEAAARERAAPTVVLRRPPPRDALFSAALFLLALAPRLYVALAWAREPVWDGHYYDFGARRIAAGLGYSDDVVAGGVVRWHPWCHYPVGYSGFLAFVYKVFSDGPRAAPVANAVTGALVALAAHRLARYAMSARRARLAGLLVALSPELVAYAALLMTEPLASLGPLVAAWAAVRRRSSRPAAGPLAAGVAIGLTTLVRPQAVLAAPLVGLVAFGGRRDRAAWARAAAAAAIATAASLAVVAPWTWRNCRVMDGCAFVSTNAGWNLAIGAFPRATGRFETLRGGDGCPVVTGQVQQDRCWGRLGLEYIRREPGRWLALVPAKLAQTFDHASFPMGYLGEADPQRFPEARKARGREVLTLGHGLLVVAASFVAVSRGAPSRAGRLAQGALGAALALAAGYVFLREPPRPYWWFAAATPLLAWLPLPGRSPLGPVLRYLVTVYASVVVTHAVFFGEDRYHVVVTPVLALLAAAALPRHPRVCGEPSTLAGRA
jgi:hypothetical protein